MAKSKFGMTLAGKLWIDRITELFGIDNRLAMGKTYFNKGLVKKFSFEKNGADASVKGNYGSYSVHFEMKVDEETAQKIGEYLSLNPMLQSALLNGELPQEFFDWADKQNIELFVHIGSQMNGIRRLTILNYKASCTCYDFHRPATPCKHVFALWYALAQEIDHNPKVLLALNGVSAWQTADDGEAADDEVAYPIPINFIDDKNTTNKDTASPLTIIHQDDALGFIMSLMPSNPPFAPIDYKEVLKEFYKAHQAGLPQILSPIFSEDIDKIERVFKESKIEIVCDKNLRANKAVLKHKIFAQEESIIEILEPFIQERNKSGCSIDMLNFTRLFLSFRGEDGSPSYRYFYQICRVGYLILYANAFIPAVIKEKPKNRFFIAWIALATNSLNEQLKAVISNATPSVRFGQRGAFFDEASGTQMFFGALFCEYVKALNFMHKRLSSNPPEISKAFFAGLAYSQKGAGKQNIDKAVANTFSIFMLSKNKYSLNIELHPSKTEGEYEISLQVWDSKSGKSSHFCEMIESDTSKYLLKIVAPINTFLPEIETLFSSQRLVLEKDAFESFILDRASLLSALGVAITLPKELHNLIKPKLSISIKSKKSPTSFLDLQKLLEYDWVIAIGEHQLSVEEFTKLVLEQGQIIQFKNHFITLTPEELKGLLYGASKKTKLTPLDVLREKFSGNAFFDKSLDEFFSQLFRPKTILIPDSLNATLRPYQTRGIEWMLGNLLNNFGTILADDMGLGKTIQTIAVILYLYENKHAKRQTLVVVPTSLLNNWQNELTKFAPSLVYTLYYGQSRKLEESKIVITTYDTLKRDEALKARCFDIVVIDEAQKIKNPDTQAALAVKQLQAKFKIALSGTPVENSLSELWSIFDFSLAGYLGDLKSFIAKYAKPIEIEKDAMVAQTLRNITAPFMLRRLKTDKAIISDLPDKIIIDEYASMTPKQAALYQSIVDETMKKLDTLEVKDRQGLVFKLITELKQVCNHPRNFDKVSNACKSLSGKSELLLEILENIVSKGEKVLIFTQYVEMAKILCEIVEKELLIEPLKLDGSMSKKARETVVDTFQSSNEHPIFILSLKAGGIGLNLTAASNVIHYDLWFNPAVENQATDRAFRIGQLQNVFVHRFITKNSFEERIDNMIKAKTAIGEMSVSVGEKSISSMSNDEIKSLFES
jgi:SNF2 family DNA or RNA helicase/uncharacterized Zn finger protein